MRFVHRRGGPANRQGLIDANLRRYYVRRPGRRDRLEPKLTWLLGTCRVHVLIGGIVGATPPPSAAWGDLESGVVSMIVPAGTRCSNAGRSSRQPGWFTIDARLLKAYGTRFPARPDRLGVAGPLAHGTDAQKTMAWDSWR